MNNKICNPKTEVEKGTTLNDKDYLEGVLTICKDLEKNLLKVFFYKDDIFTQELNDLEA